VTHQFSFPNTLIKFLLLFVFLFTFCLNAQTDWYEKDSEHFKIIFRGSHLPLVPHIINSAESSYKKLTYIFGYQPSEKIIINTYDINDYGFAAATSVPENFIRLEIEPFEPGYENTPYNERFQWVLSHELVHVFVNDAASNIELLNRKLFSKVAPLQIQPLTILYSIAANYSRYTPRWHQEALAVFLETWLSGGFGRVLGNFDEMYFRALAAESKEFPSTDELETYTSHNSFLLETLFYLYGGRFASYLAIQYDSEKLTEWFKVSKNDFYPGFRTKFKRVFNKSFDDEWFNFTQYELSFQQKNINKITSSEVTNVTRLLNEPQGWVTQAYLNKKDSSIIFGSHRSHHLAGIQQLKNGTIKEISSLPSPSIFQVASTAFDEEAGMFFYTTNNNQLYRDIWVLDISTGETRVLFPDCRTGHLSLAHSTRELWGVQHWGGRASLVYSIHPYKKLLNIIELPLGEELFNLAVNPSGNMIAAVLHSATGEQKLIVIDVESLKQKREFSYSLISEKGAPENPSWNEDGSLLLWNAYTNGVSNLYSYDLDENKTTALTNTITGLFRPMLLDQNTLFAFEFTTDGFIPITLDYKPAQYLPAIQYLGQKIIEKESSLLALSLESTRAAALLNIHDQAEYSSLSNLKILTFIPVVTGFQDQKSMGFFAHIADPLINHDLTTETAYSPFNPHNPAPKFHLKIKYDYMKKYEISVDHNASDFYDLFNKRKRGMIGTKFRLGYIHYWLYDNPQKIVQKSDISLYRGIRFINDNLVSVSEPDFMVGQTNWNSKNLRRTIGSSDFEHGDEINFTLMVFAANPDNPHAAGQIWAEWDRFRLWLLDHNVFHYKIAAGYHNENDDLRQARFYFGGFGNRLLENVDVKQFRSVFRFPGIPIYSLSADKFFKLLVENNFPPIRFRDLSIGNHIFNHIDFSLYSQSLLVESYDNNFYINAGAQINLVFKHWYNLESTLSAGVANAWSKNINSLEWFFSVKLLKN
jgi:hypothetical protein